VRGGLRAVRHRAAALSASRGFFYEKPRVRHFAGALRNRLCAVQKRTLARKSSHRQLAVESNLELHGVNKSCRESSTKVVINRIRGIATQYRAAGTAVAPSLVDNCCAQIRSPIVRPTAKIRQILAARPRRIFDPAPDILTLTALPHSNGTSELPVFNREPHVPRRMSAPLGAPQQGPRMQVVEGIGCGDRTNLWSPGHAPGSQPWGCDIKGRLPVAGVHK